MKDGGSGYLINTVPTSLFLHYTPVNEFITLTLNPGNGLQADPGF
jgi:hypothetical protein